MGTKYSRDRYRDMRVGTFQRLSQGQPQVSPRALVTRFFLLYASVGMLIVVGLASREVAQSDRYVRNAPGRVVSKSIAGSADQPRYNIAISLNSDPPVVLRAEVDQATWESLAEDAEVAARIRYTAWGKPKAVVSLSPTAPAAPEPERETPLFEPIPIVP